MVKSKLGLSGRVPDEGEKRDCSRVTRLQREHIHVFQQSYKGVSEAERCRVIERSERCERTNVASDRVARSKRDCL